MYQFFFQLFYIPVLSCYLVHELQTSLFLLYMIRHAWFQCFSLDYNLSKSLHPYFLTAVSHFLLLAITCIGWNADSSCFSSVWAYFRLRYLQIVEYCPDAVWTTDHLNFFSNVPFMYGRLWQIFFIVVLDSSVSDHEIWCYSCRVVVTLKKGF